MKTKTWILLFSGLAVLCAVLSVWLLSGRIEVQTAQVLSDGAIVQTVDLSQDQTFTVEFQGGYNTIRVENGKIFVTDASCPDKICIRHGPAAGGAPIVCLPNKLVVQFQGTDSSNADAITG